MINSLLTLEWDVIIEYFIYAAIIVAGLVALWLIRKLNRLPRHTELRKKLDVLYGKITELNNSSLGESRYDFFKQVSRALYLTDKLQYTSTIMSEKERDGDIGRIASALEGARSQLVLYKYGKKQRQDAEGLETASEKVSEAISVADKILERDESIKSRRAKK